MKVLTAMSWAGMLAGLLLMLLAAFMALRVQRHTCPAVETVLQDAVMQTAAGFVFDCGTRPACGFRPHNGMYC